MFIQCFLKLYSTRHYFLVEIVPDAGWNWGMIHLNYLLLNYFIARYDWMTYNRIRVDITSIWLNALYYLYVQEHNMGALIRRANSFRCRLWITCILIEAMYIWCGSMVLNIHGITKHINCEYLQNVLQYVAVCAEKCSTPIILIVISNNLDLQNIRFEWPCSSP